MTVDLSHPVVLRPRRVKLVALLALSLVFVAAGIYVAGAGAGSTAWIGVVFFGIGSIVFGVMLLPGASFLRLEPDGFAVCTLFRQQFYAWSVVYRFGVTRVFYRQVVGINFEPDAKILPGLRRVNTGLIGFDGMLPDTYGMGATALAELLNDALSRARLRAG